MRCSNSWSRGLACFFLFGLVIFQHVDAAYEDREFQRYNQILKGIGDHTDEIVARLSPFSLAWSGAEEWTGADQANDEQCNRCTVLVGLLAALVHNGTSYDDIKPVLMDICKEFVVPDDYNQDQLCALSLDTYAPHVIYVLNTTDKNANYICSFYYFCPGGEPMRDIYSDIKRDQHAVTSSSMPASAHNSGFLRPIRVLHITDIHVDSKYAVGSPNQCDMPLCCRSDFNGTGSAMYWGDYECNIPYRTAERIFQHVVDNIKPDLILNTGDTVQHTIWDQPQDETIATDAWLTNTLWHFFPGIPAFLSLGNHDMAPTNLYYAKRPDIQELNQALFQHWTALSKFTAEQKVTFEKGLYYTSLPFPGLRILSYNSEYGALDNFYSVLNYDEPEYPAMLQFMEDTLSAARANNEQVIMLGHHPTGGERVSGYGRFITDLQIRYADNIILHLFGHNHNDKFALVRSPDTGETRGVQISSPSLTSYTDTNPSFRVFYLDPVTFRPLDVETYHINLKLDGASTARPQIRRTWSATADYGMADATAQSFEDLTNRLEADGEFMNLFRFNVETQTGTEGDCDANCTRRLLCDLRNADYTARHNCQNAIP